MHDPAYPRNARLRASLQDQLDAEVVVLVRARRGNRVVRAATDLVGLWRGSRGADVVVLSEFRLTHAPVVWAVARLRRAVLVVDHFVGLHETVVEDWQRVGPRSVTARRLAVQDALAVRLADVCLVDTTVRADRLRARSGGRAPGPTVLALPVGAPAWARPTHEPRRDGPLRVLWIGTYLPLHGLDTIVDILAALGTLTPFAATLVGAGASRSAVEAAVADRGLADRCRFLDPVPESALVDHLHDADVVLGVFGSSRKARDVVPNKVWQGLAAGRVTVTGDGPAIRELADVVGEQLVVVDRTDPESAARRIAALPLPTLRGSVPGGAADTHRGAADTHRHLEVFTARAYERLGAVLRGEGLP